MARFYYGIAFPFQKGQTSFPKEVTDGELVKQSIVQILLTPRGARVMRPEFGTGVQTMIFENNNDILAELLRLEVSTAIARFEPRAIVQDVRATRDDTTVTIDIFFAVAATQEQHRIQVGFPTGR